MGLLRQPEVDQQDQLSSEIDDTRLLPTPFFSPTRILQSIQPRAATEHQMPELPEVERAANFVKKHAQGKTIVHVETNEDTIVFSGVSHTEFATVVQSRTVKDVKRYGKIFFLELDGEGPMPVLHFGMTGNILIKGEEQLYYKEGPKKSETSWPPRFAKFILHLSDVDTKLSSNTQIAFIDPRRLGRIRLCKTPMEEPPISLLGFDPILSMPDFEEFSKKVLKRSCPVKALLLDQSFSAGVGNWVADEILYHSHVHPEQKCNTLSSDQLMALHRNTSYVCKTAVSVNANSHEFPDNWLFNHRWGLKLPKGKGKKKHSNPLKLPSGQPATIRWLKVGGRTSAFVAELQKVQPSQVNEKDCDPVLGADEESSLTSLSDTDDSPVLPKAKARRKSQRTIQKRRKGNHV